MKSQNSFESQSRRRFLKLTGAALASGAVAQAWTATVIAEESKTDVPPEELSAAIEIVKQSSLFLDSVETLKANNISLRRDATPTISTKNDMMIGLVFHCMGNETLRHQADIVATIDLARKSVVTTQVVRGWCLDDLLVVTGTTLSKHISELTELLSKRIKHYDPLTGQDSVLYYDPLTSKYSQGVRSWDFLRSVTSSLSDSGLVQQGWPPEKEGVLYRHFDGTATIAFLLVDGLEAFYSTTVQESSSLNKSEITKTDLVYSDLK